MAEKGAVAMNFILECILLGTLLEGLFQGDRETPVSPENSETPVKASDCGFKAGTEKDAQIPTERHRRAGKAQKMANSTISEWTSAKERPKPFYDGRFSEVVRVTDGLHEAYAVYDADYHMWDIIGDEESAKSIHNISAWKPVNWVKGY